MTYGYIRVSTDTQTVENQRYEIERFAQKESIVVDDWIEETISGAKIYSKRALGKLLKRAQKGDLIIASEISRLGRSLFMVMEILNICMTKEVRVWTIKDNYRLGDDIQSKVSKYFLFFIWVMAVSASLFHLSSTTITGLSSAFLFGINTISANPSPFGNSLTIL